MGDSVKSTAKQTLWYILSYVSTDYDDTRKYNASVDNDCTTVKSEALAVGHLASARALTPGGNPTALQAAAAEGEQRIKKAQIALKSAQVTLQQMQTQLGTNGAGVGDAREKVKAATGAVETANVMLGVLKTAPLAAAAWYRQDARLNGGIAIRVETLERTRPGSTATLQREATAARTELDKAPGCDGSKWDDKGVSAAAVTVKKMIDQLTQDLSNDEGTLGQDAEAHMFDLREQALLSYGEQGTAGFSEMFDKALSRLQEGNPDLQASHLTELNNALTVQMTRARQAILAAKTPEEVQRELERATQAIRDKMADLAKKLEDPAHLQRVQTGAEQNLKEERDREAYADALEATQMELERLRIAESPDYAELQKRYDLIRTQAKGTGDLATASGIDIPALTVEAKQKLAEHQQTVDLALDPLKKKLNTLTEQFEKKQKALGVSKDAGIQALLKAIQADLDDAEGFLDCLGNVDAAAPAEGILAHAEQLLAEFDDTAVALSRQADQIDVVKQRLVGLGKRVPAEELVAVERKIAAVRAGLGTMTDGELRAQLSEIGDGIGRLESFVTDLADWREAGRRSLADLEHGFGRYASAVAQTPFTGTRPDPAKGSLRAMLDVLKEQIEAPLVPLTFEADSKAWDARLVAASQALGKLWDGRQLVSTGAAIEDGKAGLDREQASQEAQAKEITVKRAMETANSTLPATGTARAEYQTLQLLLKTAGPLIKTDPKAALLQLEDIESRLGRLPGTPEFSQAVTRAIAAVPAEWRGAVALTQQRLQELGTAIGGAAGGSPFATGLPEIDKTLDHAVDGFDPGAFTQAAAVLADTNKTPNERRAGREAALRTVRQYQALLMGDPLIRHLQGNPFKVPVFGPLFRLLETIELELSRFAC